YKYRITRDYRSGDLMIRFGPAGIPLSCKGRTLKDGIEDVHNLGLNAMEVQMVRVNVVERLPDEEEVGLTPLQIEGDMVVGMSRRKGKKDVVITDLNEEIKEEDSLITLASGLVQNYQELHELGKMGRELDVELSMHTPYYMDLVSNNELTKKSMDSIRWAGMMANQMSGALVVTHVGLYGKVSKKVSTQNIKHNLGEISAWWKENKIKSKLGLELSGRLEVWGSLAEVMDLCDDVDGPVPVINFAHYHARENGILREPSDFAELFDKTKSYVGSLYYTHFSGVEHEAGNEKRVTPIKKGDLRFEPLAEYLVEANPNITIISSSPLLEHDAMYMKVIYERILTKKVSKDSKSKKLGKDEEDEEEEEEEERPSKAKRPVEKKVKPKEPVKEQPKAKAKPQPKPKKPAPKAPVKPQPKAKKKSSKQVVINYDEDD
ncbi:MAG: TIM barrel protein, partial [Methanomassiliicoccales archaeon]|nr:TIM barrel protein [Methanomassiliicoccales archaeon]